MSTDLWFHYLFANMHALKHGALKSHFLKTSTAKSIHPHSFSTLLAALSHAASAFYYMHYTVLVLVKVFEKSLRIFEHMKVWTICGKCMERMLLYPTEWASACMCTGEMPA